MGLVKQRQIEEEMRGWHSLPHRFVCKQCIHDEYLKDAVESDAESSRCDYCGAKSRDGSPLGAPIDVIIEHVVSALRFEYNHPADELPYESAEGGYQGHVYFTGDLVRDLDISDNEDLIDDICSSVEQDQWCDRNYFSLPEERVLIGSWKAFCDTVKHKLRYLFLLPEDESQVVEEYMSPVRTLLAISKALVHTESVSVLDVGSFVYRARTHPKAKAPTCARDLGPPLPREARTSNRLSPAGIPVFYGALDENTACVEVAASTDNHTRTYITVGRFQLKTDLKVIDLATDLTLPSIFDEEHRDLRPTIQFLQEFVKDVSKPISKDRCEHIDYVPTQIVTEYLRHHVGRREWASEMLGPTPTGKKDAFLRTCMQAMEASLRETRFDGILYRSSVCHGGTCCGLFIDAESCVDPSRRKEKRARLVLDPASLSTRALKGRS